VSASSTPRPLGVAAHVRSRARVAMCGAHAADAKLCRDSQR